MTSLFMHSISVCKRLMKNILSDASCLIAPAVLQPLGCREVIVQTPLFCGIRFLAEARQLRVSELVPENILHLFNEFLLAHLFTFKLTFCQLHHHGDVGFP